MSNYIYYNGRKVKLTDKCKRIEKKIDLLKCSLEKQKKRLEKNEKKVREWSEKLQKAHKNGKTSRRRANIRIKLENWAERRNESRELKELCEEWIEELEEKWKKEIS